VDWLYKKIEADGVWTKPLCVAIQHNLVGDGQHRLEVALRMDLTVVPVVYFDYTEIDVWSAKGKFDVTVASIVQNYKNGDIYPYKTVDHKWPFKVPHMGLALAVLKQGSKDDG
jgi:hypothetical protein